MCVTRACRRVTPTCASTRPASARPFTPTRPTWSACCACRPARRGGLSALVSSTTLYNELRARRPDLAACLFEPLATDRRGEVPAGAQAVFRDSGVQLVRRAPVGDLPAPVHRLGTAFRRRAAPDAQHVEALDLFDALANDPALHFTMALERRHAVRAQPHAAARPHRVRRLARARAAAALLRLWLAPAGARPLPPVFAQRYGSVVPGDRGGCQAPTTACARRST